MCENLNEAESAKFSNRSRDALMIHFFPFNTLTPKNDKHLISPYNIIPEENKGIDHKLKKLLIFGKNSPCHYLRKCKETSTENMKTGIRLKGIKKHFPPFLLS